MLAAGSISLNISVEASEEPQLQYVYEYCCTVCCLGRLSALSLVVEQTRVCRKLLSAQGRGRYLLRLALARKALPQLITHLLHTPRVLEVRGKLELAVGLVPVEFYNWFSFPQWYSPAVSVFRNEEFVGEASFNWCYITLINQLEAAMENINKFFFSSQSLLCLCCWFSPTWNSNWTWRSGPFVSRAVSS